MLALALIAIASGASAAALLLLRRRRSRAGLLDLVPRITPPPAGLQHLARTMSDLSDLGIHLRAGRSSAGRSRLGTLLGLR
jgi:hypothetical protein